MTEYILGFLFTLYVLISRVNMKVAFDILKTWTLYLKIKLIIIYLILASVWPITMIIIIVADILRFYGIEIKNNHFINL